MFWLQTIVVLCVLSSPSEQSLLKVQTEGSDAHTMCQQTMGYFKEVTTNWVSRAEILSNLESLCEYTNSKDQCLKNCEIFLQTIGDAVSELDESATCDILLSFGQENRPYNANACSICQLVVGELKILIETGIPVQILTHLLYPLCEKTGAFASICKTVVKVSLEYIKILFGELGPRGVCQAIRHCSPLQGEMSSNGVTENGASDQNDEILIPETLLHENYKYLERVYKEYLRYVCQDYNEEDCTEQLQNAITQVVEHLQDGLPG
ncbi:hypothetical protein CSKR_201559 [Clonorchis sinensis]|uniref:Saposin B-type domain-containing protein n=1 Tax=Clonorchis sinensis TaxID=79923 RepID=A0A8T1MT86_CLOSI|nr:hypothetical protein CSKR_201559 [Clonorchis sinensis]